jgi:hypothetical protein
MVDATSPCIRLCLLDERTGFCLGCGRTVEEIGGWITMPVEARIALKADLPARLAGLASRAPPEAGTSLPEPA